MICSSIFKRNVEIYGAIPAYGKIHNNAGPLVILTNDTPDYDNIQIHEDDDINLLSISLGDIKVQSLHDNFSGFSIELEFKVKEKKLDPASWKSLNKIARHCLKIDY